MSNRCSRWHILNINIVHADKAVLHSTYAEFEEARGGIKVCACLHMQFLEVLLYSAIKLRVVHVRLLTDKHIRDCLVGLDQEAKAVYETLIANDTTANSIAYIQVFQ